MLLRTTALAILSALGGFGGQAQSTQAPGAASQVIGEVTAMVAQLGQISIKTDKGEGVTVIVSDSTSFRKVPLGAQDLKTATRIALSDLGVGDRIIAIGRRPDDQNRIEARSVIVMSRSDLMQKRQREQDEWQKRGIGGVIIALNPASREITIRAQTVTSTKKVVVALPPGATLRRYAPGSIRFSDAQPSRIEELKIGDQVKARGTRSEDGTNFSAEELVSGSFRNLAATVIAVDADRGTIQVMDLASKIRIQARVLPDSTLRRLSPAVAKILATHVSSGSTTASSVEGHNGRDLQSMIEALPPLSLAELKPGEAIVISSTTGDDPTQVTAITLLAGVEPLFKVSTRGGRSPDIGSWNLDLNMGVGVP